MKATKFKSTELGPIPVDWEVKRLGDVCSITTGHKDVNQGCKNGKYPFFTCSRNVFTANSYSFDCEAILVAGNGDVGNLHYYKGKFEAYQRTYVLKDFSEDVSYILHELTYNLMRCLSDGKIGSSIPYITIQQLEGFMYPLPPLAEQRRIARALSDVDELISALGKLIEKKRNIKTGAMQQLLTGKTRLPGFKGKWVEKRLGECGEFIGGAVFPVNRQGELYGDYPFFKVSDFSNRGNENQLRISNNYISKAVAIELGCKIIPTASIVFAKIGAAIALERKRIVAQNSCIDNNMMAFHVNNCNDPLFWVEILRGIRFSDFSESTALPALNIGRLRDFVVSVPTLAEQKAIAAVLSDMDAEIAALEADRAKYERIKSGMMQELLTGKTRLKGE